MKTRIYINKHIVKQNERSLEKLPPISISTYKGIDRAYEVEIKGCSKIIYNNAKPLKCGARIWIECDSNDVHKLS